MNPGFNDFNSFNQSGAAAAAAVSNQAAFRLNQSKPGRPNSSTPPHGHHHHHHRKNNRDFAVSIFLVLQKLQKKLLVYEFGPGWI